MTAQCLTDWTEENGLTRTALDNRLTRGWSPRPGAHDARQGVWKWASMNFSNLRLRK